MYKILIVTSVYDLAQDLLSATSTTTDFPLLEDAEAALARIVEINQQQNPRLVITAYALWYE